MTWIKEYADDAISMQQQTGYLIFGLSYPVMFCSEMQSKQQTGQFLDIHAAVTLNGDTRVSGDELSGHRLVCSLA